MSRVAVIVCVRECGDTAHLDESLADAGISDFHIFEQYGCASMGEGYNKGIEAAKSWGCDLCVFTHSDVTMWASKRLWETAMEVACLKSTGFVGVAGTSVLHLDGNSPGCWWADNKTLLGAVAHTNGAVTYMTSFGRYGRAVVMDGVFLAAKTALFETISWDESLGWHFYDIDIYGQSSRDGTAQPSVVTTPLA